MNIEEKLSIALTLRKERKYFVSNKILVLLSTLAPNDAYLHYECAHSYQLINKTYEAITHYELAIENGLTGNELLNTYLSLIQSYQLFGDFTKSQQMSEQALITFPHNEILTVFFNIANYRANSAASLYSMLQNEPSFSEDSMTKYDILNNEEDNIKLNITAH